MSLRLTAPFWNAPGHLPIGDVGREAGSGPGLVETWRKQVVRTALRASGRPGCASILKNALPFQVDIFTGFNLNPA